jgi:hypothetical protein
VQPDGNYPDIEAVEKHSDEQRGIEPIYHLRLARVKKEGNTPLE